VDELADFIKNDRGLAVRARDFYYKALDKLGRLDEKKKAQLMWRDAYRKAVLNVKDGKVEKTGEVKYSKTPYNEYFKAFSKNTLNEIKTKNGNLITTKEELLNCINKSLQNPNLKENYYISAIEETLKEKIEKDIGETLFKNGEYSFVISSDDIRHITKHFPDSIDELEAIYRLYDVVNNYDSVEHEIEGNRNKLIFKKSYTDYDFLSVEIVSKRNKSFDLVTFYVTKNNKKNRSQNNSSANTSKSGLASKGVSQPTNKTVPQNSSGVNTYSMQNGGKKSISGTRASEIAGEEILRDAQNDSGKIENLSAENTKLKGDIENLHIQLNQAEGKGLDVKEIKRVAQDFRKQYGSKVRLSELHQDLTKLYIDFAAESTRTAQSLQAISMLKKLDPNYEIAYIDKIVENLREEIIERNNKKFGKKHSTDIEVSEELKTKLMEAKTEEEREAIRDEIYTEIADQLPNTWINKWNAWRYMAMLGNARTHVRNVVGNAFTSLQEVALLTRLG